MHPKINIFFLPTVKELQLDDCLQIAMQSLVTEVSGCVSNPLEVHSFSAHTTVVPEVFSYVSTPPKHSAETVGVPIIRPINKTDVTAGNR